MFLLMMIWLLSLSTLALVFTRLLPAPAMIEVRSKQRPDPRL
jgi:hypothetical protein